MRQSDSITALAPALVKAVGAMKGATKNAKNTHFKNSYATLEAVIEASRDELSSHGLAAIQGLGTMTDRCTTITTRIIHESGEWIESEFHIPMIKADPQAAGSAVTYGRRYALMAILGLPSVDDDGEAAMERNKPADKPVEAKTHKNSPTTSGDAPKDFWGCIPQETEPSAMAAKKDEALLGLYGAVKGVIGELKVEDDFIQFIKMNAESVQKMPPSWRRHLREETETQAADSGVKIRM